MKNLVGWLGIACLAFSGLGTAAGAGHPVRLVIEDNASLFSEGAKEAARQRLSQVNAKVDREVHLKTYPNLPEAMQARLDAAGKDSAKKNEVWREFTLSHVKGERGLVVLICWKPGRVEVASDRALSSAGFDAGKTRALQQSLAKSLEAPSKNKNEPERKKELDQALSAFVNEVAQSIPLEKSRAAATGGGTVPVGAKTAVQEVEQNNMLGWVCLGIVGLMVVWMIFGAMRGSATGAAGGGYGGAPGYGGGGGGFLTNMLGGMFGAAAGMWMYNHFFGGGTPGASAGGWFGGGDSTGEEAGTGDFSNGNESGGDFGGSSDSGGGGWFGGGGDSGGGDWGGGGGDFGGGDFGGGE